MHEYHAWLLRSFLSLWYLFRDKNKVSDFRIPCKRFWCSRYYLAYSVMHHNRKKASQVVHGKLITLCHWTQSFPYQLVSLFLFLNRYHYFCLALLENWYFLLVPGLKLTLCLGKKNFTTYNVYMTFVSIWRCQDKFSRVANIFNVEFKYFYWILNPENDQCSYLLLRKDPCPWLGAVTLTMSLASR